MNRKNIPVILMLSAGAIVGIVYFVKGQPIQKMLLAIIIVFVVFYGLGSLLENILNYFDKKNEERIKKEKEQEEKEQEEKEQEEKEQEEKEQALRKQENASETEKKDV